jgi:hypothetical protein
LYRLFWGRAVFRDPSGFMVFFFIFLLIVTISFLAILKEDLNVLFPGVSIFAIGVLQKRIENSIGAQLFPADFENSF